MNNLQMKFFIYFPAESIAQEAKGRIQKDYPDCSTQIQKAEETEEYLCTVTLLVDRSTLEPVTALDEYFEGIASELGGDYDGSGTVLE